MNAAPRMLDFPKALLTAIRSSAPLFAILIATPLSAQSGAPAGLASLRGFVADSVRNGRLTGAAVQLLPGGRLTMTDDQGVFQFDSVPSRSGYTVKVVHPMLDTLGIVLTTAEFSLAAGDAKDLSLAVPPPSRLVEMFCPPGMLARGPSALVGFVRDPDTGDPIDSVTVSLVYEENTGGLIKRPVNRVAKLDAAGRYRICGLPAQMNGKVQLIRNGTQSADIPVATDARSPLALRSLGMSLATQHIATGKDSAGNAVRVLRGSGKITGRVLTKSGVPISGARVQMDETAAAAVTGEDGRFTLDSLPTGTQTVSARKIGFNVTDEAVEVSKLLPSTVNIVMEQHIPMLAPVVTVGQRDKDKERIGFTRRKRQGIGIFREGDEIPRGAASLGSALSTIPGVRVGRDVAEGRNIITAAGGPYSCMTFIVDGVLWREDAGSGSIGDYVQPDELQAIELYTPQTVPSEFAVSPQSNCRVLVLWTTRRIRTTVKPGKPPL